MAGAFVALVDAMHAACTDDAGALERAACSVDEAALFRQAVRHRCAGALFGSMVKHRIRGGAVAQLWRRLQRYAAYCDAVNDRTRAQIAAVTSALSGAGIEHALLKGAARLVEHEYAANWTQLCDIDVLVSRKHAQRAVEALQAHGYHFTCDRRAQHGYGEKHHHLAPLTPPNDGVPIELHVQLAYPQWFRIRTDWEALGGALQRAQDSPYRFTLTAFGQALHAALHGAGLYRLFDTVVVAKALRADPRLDGALRGRLSNEDAQRVPVFAVLDLAASIADVRVPADRIVRNYIEWAKWREDAPAVFQDRLQLLDAWFARAATLAVPVPYACDGSRVPLAERTRVLATRFAAGLAAAGYRKVAPR